MSNNELFAKYGVRPVTLVLTRLRPATLTASTEKVSISSGASGGTASVGPVAPVIATPLRYHCKVGAGLPLACAVSVLAVPAVMTTLSP